MFTSSDTSSTCCACTNSIAIDFITMKDQLDHDCVLVLESTLFLVVMCNGPPTRQRSHICRDACEYHLTRIFLWSGNFPAFPTHARPTFFFKSDRRLMNRSHPTWLAWAPGNTSNIKYLWQFESRVVTDCFTVRPCICCLKRHITHFTLRSRQIYLIWAAEGISTFDVTLVIV